MKRCYILHMVASVSNKHNKVLPVRHKEKRQDMLKQNSLGCWYDEYQSMGEGSELEVGRINCLCAWHLSLYQVS